MGQGDVGECTWEGKEERWVIFVLANFICVGCIHAFTHTCILDVDMVSFARFGFDVRKYGNISCAWGSTQGSRYAISPLFPIPSTNLSSFSSLSLDVNTPRQPLPTSSFFPLPLSILPLENRKMMSTHSVYLHPASSFSLFVPSFLLRSISTTDANADRYFCSLKSFMIPGTTALLADAVQGEGRVE